ncbi:hypothetical protein WBJ53_11985 [Spirosoma sp. SC4-14]|uniref:hypothetical protein n=1 Tax=Spirosoma sp. SC4-14 TaxID=3128900 RepID=UPI0030D17FDD
MNRFVVVACMVYVFSSCSFTKEWQGTSTAHVTKADFKDMTGKQVFTLHVPNNDTYLAYAFKELSGDLEATIKSPSDYVYYKKIDRSDASTIHLVNQKGAHYEVSIKGKHASGTFDVRFTSIAR